ncbi:MAG: CheR family methyltransferase [Prolixibacteraceae bacterium]
MENLISEIVDLLRVSYETDVSGFDKSFVEKSIDRRLVFHNNLPIKDYLPFLRINPEEGQQLLDSLHISYSEFFRNPLTFAYLEQFVLPQLRNQKLKEKNTEIRIWSAACASGQEAYSIAILLDELNQQSTKKINYRIFATDNNPGELLKAKNGIFDFSALQKITLCRAQKYFIKKNDSYSISQTISQRVDFSLFDLLTDQRSSPAPSIYGNFDLVICSNVLFYYMPVARKRMIEKIGKTLALGGFLVTGETEREFLQKSNYQEVYMNSAIFQKNVILNH